MTQSEIADKLGVKHNYISRVIHGEFSIVTDSFIKICEALGYDIRIDYVKRDDYVPKESADRYKGYTFIATEAKHNGKPIYEIVDAEGEVVRSREEKPYITSVKNCKAWIDYNNK